MVTFLPLKSKVLLKLVHTVISLYSTGGCHPKPGRVALHVTTPALVPQLPGSETLYSVFQGDRSPFTADTGSGFPARLRDGEEDGQHRTDGTQGSLRRQRVF